MRSLTQPGPVATERMKAVPCRAHPVQLPLAAGATVNEAITGALARAGFSSGYVTLENVAVAPMRYVIPANAPDDTHVAWYSDTHAPDGVVVIERAGVIVGTRDGEPFMHCHGIWREPDGARRAGHLLPHDTIIAANAQLHGWGTEGAVFVAREDPETNFKLFAAEPTEPAAARPNALVATIRPNGDVCLAIEALCRANGRSSATIHGVGSLVGVDFTDNRHVPSYATEVFITRGEVSASTCSLDVALVGLDGEIHEGRLKRGTNPVCITFELLVAFAD
ncbi:DUF296 domain-containing protein [Mesorhizobium sp. CAU 1741]|uniref:PCC domain-containing protein n=1 Tax=Mesorhizobium sp. CAU 1741 TaxID=3140366 RepID=UPI00325C0CDB